jgi:acetyltransferase EpsM
LALFSIHGIETCIIQGIEIEKLETIGAGTVILKDIPDGAKVVGNPGEIIN